MKYQLLPDLTEAEYASLKAQIAAWGVQVPVVRDEHGNTLDGHHRERAVKELGIKNYPVRTLPVHHLRVMLGAGSAEAERCDSVVAHAGSDGDPQARADGHERLSVSGR